MKFQKMKKKKKRLIVNICICSVISCIRYVVLEYILYKLHILIISHHRVVVLKLNGAIYLQKRKREVK